MSRRRRALMPQMIDVRSDTVTRPTPAMLEAMLQAEVGDDVFGEDETVNELQRKAADLFGKEAALFCPTGTMSNQIGIKIHTQPGDEVICDELAHIYLYEGGGIAANSGSSVRLLQGQHGRFTAAQVRENINRRDDSHLPWTRLVAVENTVNRGGGCCWDLSEIERIRAVCKEHDIAMYLAAAGLFALEHNVQRLQEDHRKAKTLEAELRSLPYVSSVLPVETNIVIFKLHGQLPAELFLQQLQHQQVRALSMGRQTIRFVFHLNVSDAQLEALLAALRGIRVPA